MVFYQKKGMEEILSNRKQPPNLPLTRGKKPFAVSKMNKNFAQLYTYDKSKTTVQVVTKSWD